MGRKHKVLLHEAIAWHDESDLGTAPYGPSRTVGLASSSTDHPRTLSPPSPRWIKAQGLQRE